MSKNRMLLPTVVMGCVLIVLLVVIFVLPIFIGETIADAENSVEETVSIESVADAEVSTEVSTTNADFYIDELNVENLKTLLFQENCPERFIDDFAEYLYSAGETYKDEAWNIEVHNEPTPWVQLMLWDVNRLTAQVQAFYGDYIVLYDAVNYGYRVYHDDKSYSYSTKYVELTCDKMQGYGNWVWTPFESAILLALLEEYAPYENYKWVGGEVSTALFNVTYQEGIFFLQNKDDGTVTKINLYADVTGLTVNEMISSNPEYHSPDVINDEVIVSILEEKELLDYTDYVINMFNNMEINIYNYWFLEQDAEFIYLKIIRPNINFEDGTETRTLAYVSKIDGAIFYR